MVLDVKKCSIYNGNVILKYSIETWNFENNFLILHENYFEIWILIESIESLTHDNN